MRAFTGGSFKSAVQGVLEELATGGHGLGAILELGDEPFPGFTISTVESGSKHKELYFAGGVII